MTSESFSWKDSFKLVLWKPTVYHNLMRSFFAGIVWFIIFRLTQGEFAFQFLVFPFLYVLVGIPMGLSANIFTPLKFITSFLAPIFVTLGDPFIWALNKFFPNLVAIEKPPVFSFNLINFVMNEEIFSSMKNATKDSLKSNAQKVMRKFK
jgi:hypothetical protein